MKTVHFTLSTLILLGSAVLASAQTVSPVQTVQAFYKFDRSHPQAFQRSGVEARKQWFSPELYALFQNELKRQTAFEKKNPNEKPYFGDGFPFQPYDETCKAQGKQLHKDLKVEPAMLQTDRAAVTATFSFPKPCTDADATTYTIGLIKAKAGWVIDDVNYGEDTTLKQQLKRKNY